MEFNVASKLLDACVLGIVSLEDTYGYDLTQKIGASIGVSETALYPVLRRLSKDELLTTYEKSYDGRNRKYYTVTEKGLEKLEFYRVAWNDYKSSIDYILEGGSKDE